MFTDPTFFFNTTLVNSTAAEVVLGNMTPGHFQVIAEVYGMDLLISLMIVSVIFQIFTFAYMIMGNRIRRMKK